MVPNQLVSPEDLVRLIAVSSRSLRLVDARFELMDPAYGEAAFAAGTLPGAVHLDLNRELAGPVGPHGGRHPLPDMERFAAVLGAKGIGNDDDVVVFDDRGEMYAARAWWLLRYAGMTNVRFLDGGLTAYRAAGGELVPPGPPPAPTVFRLELHPEMVVDIGFVERSIGSEGVLLIDARAPERYRGETEPLDPKAGHIPGAINRHFMASMRDGRFASPEELRTGLAPAGAADTVVAYCGSGVSGAHLVLALELAGYPGAKLYAGSWSDWSSYDLPVATGDGSG